ncbi:CAAX prenyl protease 2-like isoform X1 [Dendronephthya gigantea]|uniref:CAAX prenyl protease 2-like isoform X1 n=1 Tax=Dendronephthya gigantea TaxID=151771 RepID=UPI00106B3174|nr:CAAX prenyl protease 2-like isoform X1 [Dendronephthya gigantea]
MVDNEVVFDGLSRAWALGSCFFLAISYILVFYIKKSPYHRDHFETIKLRCIRATGFCFIGPIFVFLLSQQSPNGAPIWQWLGIHYENIIKAAVLPLLLTMVLFIGPITMMFLAEELPFMSGFTPLPDMISLRNFVVAPATEEMIYRACMIPLLVPSMGLTGAVFICPLLFGVAHFHHAIERLQAKENVLNVCIGTLFQFSYTTLFGIYSAFVFIRTGHLIGPFICHSFCNYMGIPEFEKIPDTKYPKAVAAMFIIGLLLFTSLLKPLTEPTLYNSVYFR